MRAIRTRAAPASGSPLPATSRAPTAATSGSAAARLAACGPRSGCRSRCPLVGLRARDSHRDRFFSGGGRGLGVSAPAPSAWNQAREDRRDPANVVEERAIAGAAGKLAVERRHGAGLAGVLVLDPGAQHRGIKQ